MKRRSGPSSELLQNMLENVDTEKVKSLEDWDKTISDLMDFQDDMNDWEYDFMDSMAKIMGQKKMPSKAQKDVLRKLERKYL